MDGDVRLRQPAALAACWRLALGHAEGSPPAGFASWPEWSAHIGVPPEEWDDGAYIEDPDGIGPAISFLKVPEPKVAKNRVHLDVRAGGGREQPWQVRWPLVTEAVERLTAAGATVIREKMQDGTLDQCGDGRPGGKRVLRALMRRVAAIRHQTRDSGRARTRRYGAELGGRQGPFGPHLNSRYVRRSLMAHDLG